VPHIYLVRHGRTTANKDGILAGRTKGIHLDNEGLKQVVKTSFALSDIKFKKAFSSPMERCVSTAEIILKNNEFKTKLQIANDLNECDYGKWQNRKLKDLRKEKLWKFVQNTPSKVTFPDGESFTNILNRFKKFIFKEASKLKKDDNLLIVSHGDPIRLFVSFCLGIDLDKFQKVIIDPSSISIVDLWKKDVLVKSMNNRLDLVSKSKSDLGGGAG
jgi:probable phosphomutase (TIGR03848 family)